MLGCVVGSDEKTLAQSLRDERGAFHATLGTPDMVEGWRLIALAGRTRSGID